MRFLGKMNKIFAFIPLALITIFFVAEAETHSHLKGTMWGMVVSFVSILFVYFLMRVLKVNRYFSIAIAFVVWLGLVLMNKFKFRIGERY